MSNKNSDKPRCRGYISSRSVRGVRYPQRVQNLVIRDFAMSRNLEYLLSSAEFSVRGSFMMLEDVLNELPSLDGIILFSVFQLPMSKNQRLEIYQRILSSGCVMFGALEQIVLENDSDIQELEIAIECGIAIEYGLFANMLVDQENTANESLRRYLLSSIGVQF